MALIKYVDTGYAVIDYFLEWDDSVYLEPDYVEDGYVGNFVFAAAELTVNASHSAEPLRILQNDLAVTATTSIIANQTKIRFGDASVSSSFSLTSTAEKQASAIANLQVVATIDNFGGRLPTASANLDAFNTVATFAGRIGNGTVLMEVVAVVTALGGKLKSASVNNYLQLQNPTPYLGVYTDGTTDVKTELFSEVYTRIGSTVQGVDDLSWGTDSVAISFYAQRFTSEGGTIFSSDGRDSNRELAIQLSLTNSSISLKQNYSAGTTGGFNESLSFASIPNNEWHHYYISGVGEVFIDGVSQGVLSGTGSTVGLQGLDGLSIGLKRVRGATIGGGGQNVPFRAYSEPFNGVVNQLWIGPYEAGVPQVRASEEKFYKYNNEGNLDVAFQDLGTDGKKSNLLPQPYYYETFAYDDAYSDDVLDGVTPPEVIYPVTGPTARATFVITGDNLRFGEAAFNSAFTAVFFGGQSQADSADLTVTTAFTATPTDFTKAESSVNAQATFTAEPTDFTKADAEFNTAANLTASANRIRQGALELIALNSSATFTAGAVGVIDASADVSCEFTVLADSTTNSIASADSIVTASVEFTPYDFTKAAAEFTAVASVLANAQLQERVRATADIAAEFAVSATPDRIRGTLPTDLTVLATFTATSLRIRPAQSDLLAFNTVLTAGKILDLIDENIIRVATESRILLAQDLQATILAVQSAQGVNTVMAEPRTIEVDGETRTLLSQFN